MANLDDNPTRRGAPESAAGAAPGGPMPPSRWPKERRRPRQRPPKEADAPAAAANPAEPEPPTASAEDAPPPEPEPAEDAPPPEPESAEDAPPPDPESAEDAPPTDPESPSGGELAEPEPPDGAPGEDRHRAAARRPPPTVLTRVLRTAGRTLITVGALFLLFAAYQIWGTGFQASRSQRSLSREFERLLSTTTSVTSTTTTSIAPTSQPAPTTTAASTATVAPQPADVVARFRSGDAVARIRAPSIGLDKIVVQGVEVDDLRRGPGHYRSTPMPGEKGNAAIAGHRTTYGAPFGDIDQLQPGDDIVVSTLKGDFTYRVLPQTAPDGTVSGHFIVNPTDVWVLDDVGDTRLTLTACHPKFSADKRIIVQARLVEPAAPAPSSTTTTVAPTSTSTTVTPTTTTAPASRIDDLNAGLGGDHSQRAATIVWGIALAVLMIAVGRATARWGRVRSWAVGAVPFLLVLFVFFEHLDRTLPAR